MIGSCFEFWEMAAGMFWWKAYSVWEGGRVCVCVCLNKSAGFDWTGANIHGRVQVIWGGKENLNGSRRWEFAAEVLNAVAAFTLSVLLLSLCCGNEMLSGDAQLGEANQLHLIWDLCAVTTRRLETQTQRNKCTLMQLKQSQPGWLLKHYLKECSGLNVLSFFQHWWHNVGTTDNDFTFSKNKARKNVN